MQACCVCVVGTVLTHPGSCFPPQVGYRVVPDRKVTKPELGHLQKAGAPAMKHLREFKVRAAAPCRQQL